MQNLEILEALEDLASTFPWDRVALWVERAPQGDYRFTAVLERNEDLGLEWDCSGGNRTPAEGVAAIKARWLHKRDPELCRQKKIEELRQKIATLQAVVIGLPPYRPNRELAAFNPIPPAAAVIEVESTKDDVPF